MFFGASDKILDIKLKEYTKCLVLRMRAVPAIDASAMSSLMMIYKKCKENGVELVFSHVNSQPMSVIKKSGLFDKLGEDHFKSHIDEALEFASKF